MNREHQHYGQTQPGTSQTQSGNNVYHNIAFSDGAKAVFGDVYTSCADVLGHLTPDEEYRTLVQALRYHGMHDRLHQIAAAIPETCEWIWSTSFDQWIRQPGDDSIFWISGKPGSGKSTLMKHLVKSRQIRQRLPRDSHGKAWKTIHFFYNFRIDKDLANTEEGMLRSILAQILEALKYSEDGQTALGRRAVDITAIARDDPLEETATTIIKFLKSQSINVLLLVDGLDECGSNLRSMVGTLKSIQCQTGIRLCLASRPEAIVQAALYGVKQIKMQELNHVGIKRYAESVLTDIEQNLHLSQSTAAMLLEGVAARADGVFLFVHFTFELIIERLVQGFTTSEISSEIREMPQELSTMYDRIFGCVPVVCREEVAFIIDLIEARSRVTYLNELFHAWYFFKTRLQSVTSTPMGCTVDQFQVRLSGLLGSIVEIKDIGKVEYRQPDKADAAELPAHRATSAHSHLLSTANQIRAATSEEVTVSLMHETVRNYIWRRDLVRRWSSHAHTEKLSELIWSKLYSEIILDAESRLGQDVWDVLANIADTARRYQVPLSCQAPKAYDGAHGKVAFFEIMTRKFENAIHDFEDKQLILRNTMDSQIYTCGLFDAVSEVHMYIRNTEADIIRLAASTKIVKSLQSPVILLHDMLRDIKRSETIELDFICRFGRKWRHDLSFAAVYGRPAYLEVYKADLFALGPDERDFLIACHICHGVSVWCRANLDAFELDKYAVHHLDHRGLSLIIAGYPPEARHVALLIKLYGWPHASQALGRIAKLRPKLRTLHIQGSHQPRELFRPFEGKHLLQVWAEVLPGMRWYVQQSLQILQDMGANCVDWRDDKTNNIAHYILDFYDVRKSLAWTANKLEVLADFNVKLRNHTSTGQSTIARLQEVMEEHIDMKNAYEQELEMWQTKRRSTPPQNSRQRSRYAEPVVFEILERLISDLQTKQGGSDHRIQPRTNRRSDTLSDTYPLWHVAISDTMLGVGELEDALREYTTFPDVVQPLLSPQPMSPRPMDLPEAQSQVAADGLNCLTTSLTATELSPDRTHQLTLRQRRQYTIKHKIS